VTAFTVFYLVVAGYITGAILINKGAE